MATVKKTTTPAKTSYNPFGGGNLIGNVKLPAVAPLPKVNLTTPKISSGGTIPVGTNLLNNKVANQVSKGAFINVGASQGNAGYNPTTGKYGIQSGSQVTSQRVATPSGTSITPTSTSTPLTSVSGSQIQPATDINLMGTNPNEYLKDYSLEVPGAVQPQETDLGKTQKQQDDVLQQMLDSINNVPSSEDAYKRAQQETQIIQKQQAVNDLTGQLNAIVNNGEALKLSLVGQGRGIPEAIIGGQQAQIARETAIQALPIQAQLSAAQGNLEMANDSLDRLFKIYSDDATNRYNARNKSLEAISGFLDKKEQRLWDEQKIKNDRAYQEIKDLHTEQNTYAKMAFETGQSSLGAKIAKLDYKSPTFKQDLAQLSSQIVDSKRNLEIQKLQKDLVNAGTTINPKILSTTQFKNAQAAQNLKLTLNEAKAAVEKYGNYELLSGTGRGILDTLKIRLASQISTALEQGVVMPGEMENFQKVAGQLGSSFFGIPNVRNSKTLGSINSLIDSMDVRVALQKAALTNTYGILPEQVDTLLNITDLSDQEFADMDALVE